MVIKFDALPLGCKTLEKVTQCWYCIVEDLGHLPAHICLYMTTHATGSVTWEANCLLATCLVHMCITMACVLEPDTDMKAL